MMQVYYVVDKPSSWFWRGGKGHIDADMVKQQLPPPSDKNLILVRAVNQNSMRDAAQCCEHESVA